MQSIKVIIKDYFLPQCLLKFLRPVYHGGLAFLAHWYFGRPSNELTVVGVTGTGGKSSTVQITREILNFVGKKCGSVTTISFFDGNIDRINNHGLSMPGGWLLQKYLRAMLDSGCEYAVVECTSEGLGQNRHLGIKFDGVVFTNLSEAHIEAHGSFKNYQRAKGKLFQALGSKGLNFSVVNLDDVHADYFLNFPANKKVGVSFLNTRNFQCTQIFSAKKIAGGFIFENFEFSVKLFGEFNKFNAFLATAVAYNLGVPLEACKKAVENIEKMRGRMERVQNNCGFTVIVDYGCEPATFLVALQSVKSVVKNRMIHVFGSTGGHRDKRKRFIFGQMSAQYADYIIITNDDVYESDPEEIAKNIESGITSQKHWNGKYEIILERQKAIRRALEVALPGDMILISGKGSEQFLVLPGNTRIAWDEVESVKRELVELKK